MTKIFKVYAGNYWSDGGALMGVLPYAIWKDKITTDERRRQKMDLNLLLIVCDKKRILVDTGLGNRFSEKQRDIYQPSEFTLPYSLSELGYKDTDITDVVMTHLHFDHAGGIITGFKDHHALTFPKAKYWIQKDEWEIAKSPDRLNKAAYDFDYQLSLLEQKGDVQLIDGEAEIYPEISCVKAGGHTVGSQYVQIDSPEAFYIYAGDIIATKFHTSLAITSAYDVCRQDTVKAKRQIYDRLKAKNGTLLLDHDTREWEIPINSLRV
ncbi:MAG: MBL fold metallo-hydrolase [Candidatus Cloacimonetes bacterium]|jgi:glyoxylase-like metal-dependent hydrolase (beta-lactamase superfamily II)|nr:MBL fold metallo-hydrolase [Candidatus Cloacimonadota bacterium]MCK9333099.1 MBL fold metallo-hydrolase [Candidatus Cloacimonadota bacterium]MDD2210639.1 MBL fold metallo-hydrolase [Candidatus Cloacimonadota bacterium]MDD4231694.1 MBL fold metallo-hydrolase [Candidatus Cloacimonadota bacterium]MDY0298672.1 MBL fold metallo-hydrolase [Candidatus Cloacimonadaceae bacterium]